MIEIGDKIISKEIFDKEFVCDLRSCKGACCVEGDSGAPLLKSEINELQKAYPIIKNYMTDMHSNGEFDDVICFGIELSENQLYKKFHPS